MNKETGELFKKLIDMFVSREEMLKELLDEAEERLRVSNLTIRDLQSKIDKIYE